MIASAERTRLRDRVLAHRGTVAVRRDITQVDGRDRTREVGLGHRIGQRHLDHVGSTGGAVGDEGERTRRSGTVDCDSIGDARRDREVEQRAVEHRAGRGVLDLESGVTGEVDRDDRSEIRGVGCAASQLAGDDRDLDPRGQGTVALTGTAQLVPPRAARRVGKPVAPSHVVEVVDRLGPEVGDERRGAALQLELLVGVPGVHGLRLLCFLDPRRGPRAQRLLLDLAGRVDRELVDELDRTRHLVVRHLRRAPTR